MANAFGPLRLPAAIDGALNLGLISSFFLIFFFIFGLQNPTWSSAIREGLANVDECYPFKEDIMFATAISMLGLSLKFI